VAVARAPDARPRGDARRQALVDAALGLLRDGGLPAVTHRAVARRASVPLAATTYHFASKLELLEEALTVLASEEVARLGSLAASLDLGETPAARRPAAVAALLAPALCAEHAMMLPKFDVYLQAARSPDLRGTVGRWLEAFGELARTALREAGAAEPDEAGPILVAAIDGMMVHRLATSGGPFEEPVLRRRLEVLIRGLG